MDGSGLCELCGSELEDLAHLLVPRCPLLADRRDALLEYSLSLAEQSPLCLPIINTALAGGDEAWVQFVLDCSTSADTIVATQSDPQILKVLFKITRTWCYSLHRSRMKLLGHWVS